jgi:nitrous oxide reductase
MADKTTQLAQSVVQRLSRRGFMGRVARGAGLAAAALGGVLAVAGNAHAKGAGKACYLDSDCPKGQVCIYLTDGYWWDGEWGGMGVCWSPPKGKGHNK